MFVYVHFVAVFDANAQLCGDDDGAARLEDNADAPLVEWRQRAVAFELEQVVVQCRVHTRQAPRDLQRRHVLHGEERTRHFADLDEAEVDVRLVHDRFGSLLYCFVFAS